MSGRRVLNTGEVMRVEMRLSRSTASAVYALAEAERLTLSGAGERLIRAGLAALEAKGDTV